MGAGGVIAGGGGSVINLYVKFFIRPKQKQHWDSNEHNMVSETDSCLSYEL